MQRADPADPPVAMPTGAPGGVERWPAPALICTPTAPPSINGTSVVLARMLASIHPDDVRLVSGGGHVVDGDPLPDGLPVRTWARPSDWRPPDPDHYPLRHVRAGRRFGAQAVSRARFLAGLIRQERCGAVVAVSGLGPDPLACLLAARATGRPLAVWWLDDWRLQLSSNPVLRPLAGTLERVVIQGATLALTHSDGLAAEFAERHGRRPVVVANPLAPGALDRPAPSLPWPTRPDSIAITYTGQVYGAQADSLERLLRALEAPDLGHVTLHIHGDASEASLSSLGLAGRYRLEGPVPMDRVADVQARADILYLPLAFESIYPGIIRTAAPSKLGDYLVSGRPILTHAPPDSWLVRMAREGGFAEVVDTPSPDALAAAIRRLSTDADLRARLVAGAAASARRLFSPAATTQAFHRSIGAMMVA